ncbi:MAG: hypothetical protein QM714_15265 [Nocardioides sp.]|uniref:hypothetical protein n=1 Tax=Nocardioides sp. TaxID=35761 RepID=UPI0039E278AD
MSRWEWLIAAAAAMEALLVGYLAVDAFTRPAGPHLHDTWPALQLLVVVGPLVWHLVSVMNGKGHEGWWRLALANVVLLWLAMTGVLPADPTASGLRAGLVAVLAVAFLSGAVALDARRSRVPQATG